MSANMHTLPAHSGAADTQTSRRQVKQAAQGLIISPPPASASLTRHSYHRHFHAAKSPPLTPITGSSTCSVHSRRNGDNTHRSFELEIQIEADEERPDFIYSTDSPFSSAQSRRVDQATSDGPGWRTPASLSMSDSSTCASPTPGDNSSEGQETGEILFRGLDSPTIDFAQLHKDFAVASPSESELGITESPLQRELQYGDIFIQIHPDVVQPPSPLRKQLHQVRRQSPLSLSHVPILLDSRPTTPKSKAVGTSATPIVRRTKPPSPSPTCSRLQAPSALTEFASRELPAVPGGRPYKPIDLFGAKQAMQETEELDLSFAEMPVSYRRPSLPTAPTAASITSETRKLSLDERPLLFTSSPTRAMKPGRGPIMESVKFIGVDYQTSPKSARMYDMI